MFFFYVYQFMLEDLLAGVRLHIDRIIPEIIAEERERRSLDPRVHKPDAPYILHHVRADD